MTGRFIHVLKPKKENRGHTIVRGFYEEPIFVNMDSFICAEISQIEMQSKPFGEYTRFNVPLLRFAQGACYEVYNVTFEEFENIFNKPWPGMKSGYDQNHYLVFKAEEED